jgi:dTDP-4-dehydrorhamnose reductase
MSGENSPINLLQFGRSGQLGGALVEALAKEKGFRLAVLGRGDADFTKPQAIEKAILEAPELDIVVNTVAYTAVDRAEAEQELAHRVNAEAVGHLARACRARGVPLVHISTDYVYDGAKSGPYLESDAPGPINVYGQTKLAGEELIRGHIPAHVILRTSWIFSARGQNFLKTMLRLGAEREEVRVVDDQWGAPTSATDLANAIITIARQIAGADRPALFGTFHFADAGETSWYGFAEEIFRQARLHARAVPISTAEYPTPARRPQNSRLDTGKISRIFGIHPPSWQTSLAATLAGMQEKHL